MGAVVPLVAGQPGRGVALALGLAAALVLRVPLVLAPLLGALAQRRSPLEPPRRVSLPSLPDARVGAWVARREPEQREPALAGVRGPPAAQGFRPR